MPKREQSPQTAREAALRALVRVESDGAYLNLALPAQLQNLPDNDRALAVQLATGTLQRLNSLDWALDQYARRSIATYTPWMRNLLRLSAYQLLYLDKIPDYAIVSEAVNLARRYGHRGVAALVNALLRKLSRERAALPWPDPADKPALALSLQASLPLWLSKRVIRRFGLSEATAWAEANNRQMPVTLRPNLLRTSPEQLLKMMRDEGYLAFPSTLPAGLICLERTNRSPAASTAFQEGLFTIQGASSALVAPLLAPRPGDILLDLCSAPGGKTTHLAELLNDEGSVYALDLHVNRVKLVEKAAKRLGLKSIKPLVADARAVQGLNLPAPRAILVDAPCSGLGVIGRLPEIKWRRQEQDLDAFQQNQLALLEAAAEILAPGGTLLYSVCTTEPEETSAVVNHFNFRHGHFSLQQLKPLLPASLHIGNDDLGPLFLWPHLHQLDGFFIASWTKNS